MLGTAGLVIPLMMRLGVSSILGYLIVGILLGPDIMGRIAGSVPALSAFAFSRQTDLTHLAELGVVFLLFLIGLELSLERLKTMRRLVFGLGGLQVLVTMSLLTVAAGTLGFAGPVPLLIGMALSLSSTAIVIQLYSDTKRLGTQPGRASFAILLMQDLAVIPMLMLLGLMSGRSGGSLASGVMQAIVQAVLAIVFIVLTGRYALRPFLKFAASSQSADLFMAAVLFIAVGTGALANMAGLSMSLGAFIAGLMLAETEYRRAVEAIIEPFKGILLGAFFLLVGLGLDLTALAESPLRIIAFTVALIAVKSVVIYALARLMKVAHMAALECALLLGPCGEFAYVMFATATANGIITSAEVRDILLVVTLSMMSIPVLSWLLSKYRLQRKIVSTATEAIAVELPAGSVSHIIVAGFGRVGTLVGSMLKEHDIPYIAVDGDAALVERERRNGLPVYYGDATNIDFLRKCGLAQARGLAVTMDNPTRAEEIVKAAKAERPDLKVIARARDERHAMRLYAAGATEAVPETIESSLQLGEALLVESGIPMGLAIASIHERRDGFRKLLGRPNRREELKSARKRLKSSMR